MENNSNASYAVLLGGGITLGVIVGAATGHFAIWLPIGMILGLAAGRALKQKALSKSTGIVIGLAVAAVGTLGLLTGYVPPMFSGVIAMVAIGIIVATRRASLRPSTGN